MINTKNLPTSLILATIVRSAVSLIIDVWKIQLDSIVSSDFSYQMSKIKQILAWIAIIGGGIGFFFFSQFMAEVMR